MNTARIGSALTAMTKSVCIIGAGPSGLVAAKNLLHNSPVTEEFNVTIFDARSDIGGLWPLSKEDNNRQVHPLMLTNQSKHTVHFSDLTWSEDTPQFPQAWQVGQYLRRYYERYLRGNSRFELKLNSTVARTQQLQQTAEGQWDVLVKSDGSETSRSFDYLLVSTGFFGKPIVPDALKDRASVPVVHSSQYRDLKGLLGSGKTGGGKILVVGGQMSGVEIAGTIASHLSSAVHSPEDSGIVDVDKVTIHHVLQRPVWVFPLFTTPEPMAAAAPFLPCDFAAYNRNNRPRPLVDTQGHISEEAAKTTNGIFQAVLGSDQSAFSPLLTFTDEEKTKQPYLAMSDWYCDFVRSGLIELSGGKVESVNGNTATVSGTSQTINDIAAVVVATGYDPSPCIDFLPREVLDQLHHDPQNYNQPVALAFHETYHPAVPGLGFVGFYRSPYWGVMEMQARFVTKLWSGSPKSDSFTHKLKEDVSTKRTMDLRGDPRISQFPMGDYQFLMQELSEALDMTIRNPAPEAGPCLSSNQMPLDMLTPARYPASGDSSSGHEEANNLLEQTQKTVVEGLTTPKFVARAVFRSLSGTWTLERDLISKLPTHPSGHFSGKAHFYLRSKTSDGLQCAAGGASVLDPNSSGMEYLYVEDGEFKTDSGLSFRATRRYIWRYDEADDKLSVWFAKPDDLKRADYLFHEVEFEQPKEGREKGWQAKAGHLCIEDFYDVNYRFNFQAVNLKDWNIEYQVKGPKKDYTIHGTYRR